MWGVDLDLVAGIHADFAKRFVEEIKPYVASGQVINHKNTYMLSQPAKHFADRIAMELFIVE
jgi:hypothetical protein